MSAESVLASGGLSKHSTSQRVILSDEECRAGIARIERDIDVERAQGEALTLVADLRLHGTRTARRD